MQDSNIEFIEFPAKSRDKYPGDYLWGVVVMRIYRKRRQFSSVKYLEGAMQRSGM